MAFFEVEFEEEIELSEGNKFIPVVVVTTGNIDSSDQTVSDIKLKVYHAESEKRICLKSISKSEVQRLIEESKEKLLNEYRVTFEDEVTNNYDDGIYYETSNLADLEAVVQDEWE